MSNGNGHTGVESPQALATREASVALTPSDRYRKTVEALATRELAAIMGDDEGRRAAAGFALAFRQAAIASPGIYDCSPQSVGQALALSLLTRLMPGGPLPAVYLIPRKIKGDMTLQWQASWRGLQILAARAGYRVRTGAVYAGDHFRFRDGVEQVLEHEPADKRESESWEALRGCWVVAHEVRDGGKDRLAGICFVSRDKIEARRAVSDAWKRDPSGSPWGKWPEEMALKTAIRYAISRGVVQLDEIGGAAYAHDATVDRGDDAVDVQAVVPSQQIPSGAQAQVRAVLDAVDAPPAREEADAAIDVAAERRATPKPEPASDDAAALAAAEREEAAALAQIAATTAKPALLALYRDKGTIWTGVEAERAWKAAAHAVGVTGLTQLRREAGIAP